MILRCLIIDDEPLAQSVIENYMERVNELQLVKKCSNAMEGFEILHKEKIDIIFLDIQMPVIDGLNFIKSLSNPPAVILTTAFPNHALEGYELGVVDYLLKPISFERFLKAVNKVIEQKKLAISNDNSSSADFIFVKVDSKLIKLNFDDIFYIEGMKDYLKIFTKVKMYVVHQTMKKMEELLPRQNFLRVHKSYIVSLKAVKSIVGNMVEIENNQIPIGNNYKDNLIKSVFKIQD